MAGGVGPLALALLLLVCQPESPQFLAVCPGNERRSVGWNFDTTFAMLALPSLAAAGTFMLTNPQLAYAPVNTMEP